MLRNCLLHVIAVTHLRRRRPAPHIQRRLSSRSSSMYDQRPSNACMEPAAATDRDWTALPAGALQHVFRRASTWQTPGSCLGSPVCRNWQAAGPGCRGIRLLYNRRHGGAFATWLSGNGQQLEALTLSSYYNHAQTDQVLEALADAAAAAAQAAGGPFPLHTLRIPGYPIGLALFKRLLAGLPHLGCLQVCINDPMLYYGEDDASHLQQYLAPLQEAGQLRELYINASCRDSAASQGTATALPGNLQRLSWQLYHGAGAPDMSHLVQLSFLQLLGCSKEEEEEVSSKQLPPGLQELQLVHMQPPKKLVLQRSKALARVRLAKVTNDDPLMEQLPLLTNVAAAAVEEGDLHNAALLAALVQLPKLSALTVHAHLLRSGAAPLDLASGLAAAADIPGLRSLVLGWRTAMPAAAGLAAVTGLTRLAVFEDHWSVGNSPVWAPEVALLTSLRWLSVPCNVLKVGAAWLGGLQQLRVLIFNGKGPQESAYWHGGALWQWLEGCSREDLPLQLQLLGVCNGPPGLRQRLASSGLEVVVGVDLDEVCDPVKQLAGLPEVLQQALV